MITFFQAYQHCGVLSMVTDNMFINYKLHASSKSEGRFFMMVNLSEPNVDFSAVGAKARQLFNCTIVLAKLEENNTYFKKIYYTVKNGILLIQQIGIGRTNQTESVLTKTITLSGECI